MTEKIRLNDGTEYKLADGSGPREVHLAISTIKDAIAAFEKFTDSNLKKFEILVDNVVTGRYTNMTLHSMEPPKDGVTIMNLMPTTEQKDYDWQKKIAEAEQRAAEAESRAETAEADKAAAEQRAEEAEAEVDGAKKAAEEAEARATQAEAEAETAKEQAVEAETRATEAEVRAESAEQRAQEAEAQAEANADAANAAKILLGEEV